MENTPSPPAPDASKVSADSLIVEPAFGLGRLAPFNWERFPHSTAIRLFWGRIVVWLLILACLGWLATAGALFAFVKYRRGFSEVQFNHMLFLPWKLAEYRHSKGEFMIKEGIAYAEKQEWRTAFDLLRPGLLAVPENRDARLILSRLYLMAGRPDLARTLLIDGLAYHANRVEYLYVVVGYFTSLQADDTIIELVQDMQRQGNLSNEVNRFGKTALAFAYYNRGKFSDAEGVLDTAGLRASIKGRLLVARLAWARGRHDSALAQLIELSAQVPEDEEIYRSLVEYLTIKQRWATLRRASWLRQLALPDQPAAYVDFINACGEEGDTARRLETEAAFYERFTDNTQALLALAESAAQNGRLEVTQRVAARCRELKRDEIDAVLLVLRAQLETRSHKAVIEQCIDLGAAVLKWPERQRLVLGGLRAVALYGLSQEAEAEPLVRRLWETRVLSAQVLAALALQVERVGHGREARRILRQAVAVDPLNQPALVFLLRSSLAEDELQDAPALIERLLSMRNPPEELLAGLSRGLGSDRYLLLPERIGIQVAITEYLRELKRRKAAE
jgi:tetratricopeptide (TPR) repeat protein